MKKNIPYILAAILFFFSSCASYKTSKMTRPADTFTTSTGDTNIFLVGDAGKPENGGTPSALLALKEKFSFADENDILLFLGDNVYQKGIPEKNNTNLEAAQLAMQIQIDVAKEFPGKIYFIPGNHDWYSGLKGLKRQELMVEEALGEEAFLPDDGCPFELISVNDELSIIAIDSHWYVTNWKKHPTINENCGGIQSRNDFWNQLNEQIQMQQNKTLIVAIHHPLFSNGEHGGYFKVSPLFPINAIRSLFNITDTDLHHPRYKELRRKLTDLITNNEHVILVSGHEHNLQYIERNGIKQIISGSGSKKTPLRVKNEDFGFSDYGFAILQLNNHKQKVTFFDKEGIVLSVITVNE